MQMASRTDTVSPRVSPQRHTKADQCLPHVLSHKSRSAMQCDTQRMANGVSTVMLAFGVAQSHRVTRTHRHTVTQCQTLAPTPSSLTFLLEALGRSVSPRPTSRPWERGRGPGGTGGRGPPWPCPLGGVQSSEAEHWSHLFLSTVYRYTSQSKRRAEGPVPGERQRRAPPTLSPARGVACLSPPFGLSESGAGRGVALRVVPVQSPPLKKGAEGSPAISRFPRLRTLRDLAPRTTSQHGRQEDCHLRRHRQDRAHHAGSGGASRHELGRAGDVTGCTG